MTLDSAAATRSEAELRAQLDPTRLPVHVAIIMDGNGRWARARGLPRIAGHRAGTESVRAVIRTSHDVGLKQLTLYTFSAENWRRPRIEVEALMELIDASLQQEVPELHRRGIRLRVIGRIADLSESLQATIRETEEMTAGNPGLGLNLAINYGGRREIADAAAAIAARAKAGEIDPAQVDEAVVAQHLYRPDLPDPDLLVRTAGEMRVSNYLLWQIAYAEIWVTPVLWPDFRASHLLQALGDFQQRRRRFGGVDHAR